tara:strand:- start:192 stop:596 length:405 start_codon:yes stop_codon:yes gene_type:complete
MACMNFTVKNYRGEWKTLVESNKGKGVSPQQTVTGFNDFDIVNTRNVLRDSWQNHFLQNKINGHGRVVTPFRASQGLGDFLGRKNTTCGLRGGKCDASKIESASGNVKFVSDSSLYTRFRRETAIGKNYNDYKL